jgi:hypothetical protein
MYPTLHNYNDALPELVTFKCRHQAADVLPSRLSVTPNPNTPQCLCAEGVRISLKHPPRSGLPLEVKPIVMSISTRY